jgi:hypothetical protein
MIMIVRLIRRAQDLVAAGVALGAAIIAPTVTNADVGFVRNGPFEVCLNGAYAGWIQHQAELLVSDYKLARSLNDTSVAAWTGATLDDCRKKGEATPGSVDRFGRHMARWRDHVVDQAESIRRRGQSD